jgi:hypothetical protein
VGIDPLIVFGCLAGGRWWIFVGSLVEKEKANPTVSVN